MEMISCQSYHDAQLKQLSRRTFLAGGLIGTALLASSRSALSQTLIRKNGNVIVVVFLRGGADGLTLVVPYAEEAYYKARPTLAVARPGSAKGASLKLDEKFSLNASLSPLMPLFENGELGIVHAVGSQDRTRSHFEAMSAMEHGAGTDNEPINGGWLARYLLATSDIPAPLRAVALSSTLPESLNGATQAVVIESLEQYRLNVPEDKQKTVMEALDLLYSSGSDPFSDAGRNTLRALRALGDYNAATTKPEGGAVYPGTSLGKALSQIAYLVRKDVGLEIACVDAADRGGWDTHVAQGPWIGTLLDDLGGSLAAFRRDLGSEISRVTVVVQTEFGRRLEENSGYGTDHGRASVMFALGGGVKGGQVIANWPGLAAENLEGPGDLRVTTDYRDVLSELLTSRLKFPISDEVFPNHSQKSVGLFD